MKSFLFVIAGIFAVSGNLFAHDPTEGPVSLEPESLRATAGRVRYEFQLVDTKSEKLISDKDLNITHEKKLHFIAYDPALKEFLHVHPAFNGTLWTVDLDIAVDGQYFVWAQGELSAGNLEFTAGNRLTITGGRPAWPAPPSLQENRSETSGTSKATLSNGRLVHGQMAMLTLTFSRTDGTKPEISPYLGAFAHAVVVPDDGDSLMHVHPMDGAKPTEGMLHLTFPDAGFYRVWVQFVDSGTLKTVALSVQVF